MYSVKSLVCMNMFGYFCFYVKEQYNEVLVAQNEM